MSSVSCCVSLQPPPPPVPPPPSGPSLAGPVVPANPMMPYSCNVYEPVQPHWFYCKQVESRNVWYPLSILDSMRLEETFNSGKKDIVDILRLFPWCRFIFVSTAYFQLHAWKAC